MSAIGEQMLSVKIKIRNYLMELFNILDPRYAMLLPARHSLWGIEKIWKNCLQLEWARDCKANDYVYLGQVSHIDETKDINKLYAVRDESIV